MTYLVAWAAIGTAVAIAVVAARGGPDPATEPLPPVQETALASAARAAGCRMATTTDRAPGNPPAGGTAAATPARPGVYEKAPTTVALIAALRRGTIVVHYRAGVDDEVVDLLETVQATVPRATILTPNATGMPYEVAVTAYHRVLGCPRFTTAALDALRLFRGRYLGSGPRAS